ncbi:TraR/DksA family transcriptional regulator [Salmonella enterica]|nr:TraR/DksA family transcriptional regulator [Salmonella enterica subsp. enterica]EKT1260950.1 TraR/DksA family transcriptional regulator [Salmonella enterica]EKT1325614.1 TraR/DksA family transcriptional regulator [Salmonella enterica]EKT1358749.1 TraR/DksA family transcriptional regulator [Salmonella enterica]EKT2634783.1 TraR/DksA family transcriptional regulator [Salmonella enterica]
MADEIDRDQEFNEQQLEAMIARARSAPAHSPSLHFCRQCGEAIPEKRRLLLPGITLCIDCQTENERKRT